MQYNLEDFIGIIRKLRSKDGCPWDKVQTHESLKICMIEEANEVVEGIDILTETGDADNLCEELGDVLLQVVFHAQLAEDEGLFTLDDVIQGVSEKMVRRHPHVFEDIKADSPEAVLQTWEEIKRQEKIDIAKNKKIKIENNKIKI